MKSIALCGFMGCGKSTVAQSIEKLYAFSHIDTDSFVEEKENMTISKMFEKYGENYFRDKEYEAICELSKKNNTILALGGGAVMFARNVQALKDNGCKIVFIDTDFDVINERLKNDTTRPLLKQNDIKALYEKRLPIYNDVCDIKISCKNEDSNTIAHMIFEKIKKV